MRLQDLILTRKRELGMSYDALVEAAEGAGYHKMLSKTRLFQLATKEIRNVPPTQTLLALAAAIQVDPEEVVNAAAESVGIELRPTTLSRETRAWLALTSGRSPEQVAKLLEIARTVAETLDTRDQ